MTRLLIVGISGTGKTYLAKDLSQKLNLPVIHLDSIFWKDKWQEQDEKIVVAKIKSALSQPKWIIEGYIEPLGKERVKRAEQIVYLDYSGMQALNGGIKRWLQLRKGVRPEMPTGNTETLGFRFLWTMLRRHERPEIESVIKGFEQKTVRLKSPKQTKNYLRQLVA